MACNLSFKISLFANDFVMERLSSLLQIPTIVFSFENFHNIRFPRFKMMALCALSTIVFLYASNILFWKAFSPPNIWSRSCVTSNTYIFNLYIPKSFFPANFSTSDFVVAIITLLNQAFRYNLLWKLVQNHNYLINFTQKNLTLG